MSKLNCDVINDLIPSYIDGICSQSSKVLVEEHILECRDCKNLIDIMVETEIVSKQADRKVIDYMNGVKKHYNNKNIISLGLLIAFIVIGMAIIIGKDGTVPLNLYYVILPVLMLSAYFILSDNIPKKKNKGEKILTGIGIIVIVYCIILQFMCVIWTQKGTYPFGLQLSEIGPFVYKQLMIIAIYQVVIFLGSMSSSIKAEKPYNILLTISIIGSCLALAFISILKNLSTIVSFESIRNRSLVIILLEGVVMSCIIYGLGRKVIWGSRNKW